MIKLKITKFDKNEKYNEQLEAWEKARTTSMYRNEPMFDRPEPMRADSVLEVEVTEEQFDAIRKAVLEKF
jgi:hypothetical protein